MTKIKAMLLESWRAKLASLLIAIAVWYLIKSHLDAESPSFPVPGTGQPRPVRTTPVPGFEDTLLSPLSPPVPGGGNGE